MFITALALLACASVASAGIVDPLNSTAQVHPGEPTNPYYPKARVLCAPGGGDSFIFPQDHQVDVYVADSGGDPVEIVASDIWMDNADTEPCPGEWIADSSTYAPNAGHTTFTGIPRGGVPQTAYCRDTLTDVVAVGQVIESLWLHFVSPDLNGDLVVNSTDFAIFASCYNLPCPGASNHCYCADLNKSDEDPPGLCVGSTDFAIFASYYNNSICP
jgi:hypothetical protein